MDKSILGIAQLALGMAKNKGEDDVANVMNNVTEQLENLRGEIATSTDVSSGDTSKITAELGAGDAPAENSVASRVSDLALLKSAALERLRRKLNKGSDHAVRSIGTTAGRLTNTVKNAVYDWEHGSQRHLDMSTDAIDQEITKAASSRAFKLENTIAEIKEFMEELAEVQIDLRRSLTEKDDEIRLTVEHLNHAIGGVRARLAELPGQFAAAQQQGAGAPAVQRGAAAVLALLDALAPALARK